MPLFQINQLVQILRDVIAIPYGLAKADNHFTFDVLVGLALFMMIYWIVMGKLTRITAVATKVVPIMVIGYFIMTLALLVMNYHKTPETFMLIFSSAFSPGSAAGGLIGTVNIVGVSVVPFLTKRAQALNL